MTGKTAYLVTVMTLGMIVLMHMYARNPDKFIKDVKTPKSAGWVKGVILFVAILTAPVAVFGSEPKYFTYTEIFIGLDSTWKQSPQCEKTGYSDKLTSNGGLKQNIVVIDDFEMNAKYTHHSCAQNEDRNSYDAIGLEVTYRWNWH